MATKYPFFWQDHATPADLADINACSGCKVGWGRKVGICRLHYRRIYNRVWYRANAPAPAPKTLSPDQLILLALVGRGVRDYSSLTRQIGQPFKTVWERAAALTRQGYLAATPSQKTTKARTLRLTEAGERAACGLLLSRRGERVSGVWEVRMNYEL